MRRTVAAGDRDDIDAVAHAVPCGRHGGRNVSSLDQPHVAAQLGEPVQRDPGGCARPAPSGVRVGQHQHGAAHVVAS